MQVSWVVGSDCFCAFEIEVYLPSVEYVENGLTTGMHEIFVDIVHTVVDENVSNSFGLKIIKFIPLFDQILVDLIMVLCLFVFMFEKEGKHNCSWLWPIDDLQNDENDSKASHTEKPTPKSGIILLTYGTLND